MLAPFPTLYAPTGMVCSVDHLASSAGLAMLRAGGSAADAAVAAGAVLAVTTQHLCGMGGDLFALVAVPGSTTPACLDASGRAGSGADADRLRREGHRRMPAQGDIRAVPVPGCVDGWLSLHARFGRLALSEVLEPASTYAADGFPASPTLAASAPRVAGIAGARDFEVPGGVRPGTILRRPGAARALAAIAHAGRDGFYGGEFGRGLLELGGGEYAPDDLAHPLADWVPPLGLTAWGNQLWTVPPVSQGYLTLAGAWIAEGLPIPDDPDDPRWAHLLVEAARQAGWDRLDVLSASADGAALVAPERLAPRRAAISPDRAALLDAALPSPGDTIYLCAVDGEHMGVSLIQSNAAGWGAGIFEPHTGISLQNRGVGFSLVAGHPAEYGPGRRPPHTLAPALVTDDGGRLRMTIGTMGGDSQPQVLLQLLVRLLVHGQSPAEAIGAGRWALTAATQGARFDTWEQRGRVAVAVEGHAPGGWDAGLAARGHEVQRGDAFTHGFGHAHVIVDRGDHLAGAADPRPRGGAAAGW